MPIPSIVKKELIKRVGTGALVGGAAAGATYGAKKAVSSVIGKKSTSSSD